jgi:hypothetical protein
VEHCQLKCLGRKSLNWSSRLFTPPLGDIKVLSGTPDNFHKEMPTFEVVGFRGAYHASLGRSCYAKFMAVPNYTTSR